MREPGGGCPEGGSAGAAPRPRFLFCLFFTFGCSMTYIPIAPDSFRATGCPRSKVDVGSGAKPV